MNNLREIRKTIYHLKRRYGGLAAIYNPVAQTQNIRTGKVDRTFEVVQIRKLIALPAEEFQRMFYDSAPNQGAFFTASDRVFMLDGSDLPKNFTLRIEAHILFDNERYEISDIHHVRTHKSFLIEAKALSAAEAYHPAVIDFINAGWVGTPKSLLAIDELARAVAEDVFSGTVPADFVLFPFVGKNIGQALKALWHPNGVGYAATGTLTSTEYTESGLRGGVTGEGSLYADLGIAPSAYSLSDFHFSLYGCALDDDDNGALDGTEELTLSGASASLDGDSVAFSTSVDTGHILMNTDGNLEIFVDGSSDGTIVQAGTTMPTINTFILAVNTNGSPAGFNEASIRSVTMGPGLTSTQIGKLASAITLFNRRLGRLTQV
jgi:hypothetical protein